MTKDEAYQKMVAHHHHVRTAILLYHKLDPDMDVRDMQPDEPAYKLLTAWGEFNRAITAIKA